MSGHALDLALAKAHVVEFEVRVATQSKLLAKLVEAGRTQDAEEARQVLIQYHEALDAIRSHLRRLQDDAPGHPPQAAAP
jgi:uncharacterized coiled-coil protein SlyX